MEDNGRYRRHNDPYAYTSTRIGQDTPRRSSGVDRFRTPSLVSREPAAGASPSERNATYTGYYVESPQFSMPALQPNPIAYQSDFTQDQPRQPYSPYGPGVMYSVAQQSAANTSYDALQYQQPPRTSTAAAIEVASSGFPDVPSFYSPAEPTTGGPVAHQSAQAYTPITYGQQTSMDRSMQQPYNPMHELPPSTQAPLVEQQEYEQPSNYENEFNEYQTELKRTFEAVRDGQLKEASNTLLRISNWLLTHVVELGLVRDESSLHAERLKLWTEFNHCWLAVLQKQKDMTQETINTGHHPHLPQSLISEGFLERLGRDLVHLCDGMERHGLVDYQMGVWEEEIIEILRECLELLEENDEGAEATTNRSPNGQS